MKGYLRDLAERAMGHPPALRPAPSSSRVLAAGFPVPPPESTQSFPRSSPRSTASPAHTGSSTGADVRTTSNDAVASLHDADAGAMARPLRPEHEPRPTQPAAPRDAQASRASRRANPEGPSADNATAPTRGIPQTASPDWSTAAAPPPTAEPRPAPPPSVERPASVADSKSSRSEQRSDDVSIGTAAAPATEAVTLGHLDSRRTFDPPPAILAPSTGEQLSIDGAAPGRNRSSEPERSEQKPVRRANAEPVRPRATGIQAQVTRASGAEHVRPTPVRAPVAPPDVHIHIGRIELTAISTPAPQPRRDTRATARRMTLDQYLGRRDGNVE
jgi:hypothetical protein